MTLQEKTLEEIENLGEEDIIMDTHIKCLTHLGILERRQILFDLEQQGKLQIRRTKQINDPDFPLIIIVNKS